MKKKYQAVITADMVNSTHFSTEQTGKWLEALIAIIHDNGSFKWLLKPEIYRGDSFQGVLENPEDTLKVAVLSRTIMRSYSPKSDLRIAIGIGTLDLLTDRPGTSDGEAFRLSGHLADNIKKQKARIGIALPQNSEPLNAIMDLLETLMENWTTAQSEVIAALIQNKNISEIVAQLSISQPAVSQRITSSKWWAMEHFLRTFPEHLALYIKIND
ncbi:SatD family protein [Dyadobacter sp. CY356]|uniref:SatD family protein n=1 Tax=Dyadobacter sp. CY356 TaxID=2906442 RepID=UPI001F28900C|nr:SatD family protein [Dyadobacter sp. CY356]MCF0054467.1 SatD family protein [Dyadobacter sp. CY356]